MDLTRPFRDIVRGVPPTDLHQPRKTDMADWGDSVEGAIVTAETAIDAVQQDVTLLQSAAWDALPYFPAAPDDAAAVTAGLAATTDGQQFRAGSTDPDVAYVVYQNSAGSAVALYTQVSVAGLSEKEDVTAADAYRDDAGIHARAQRAAVLAGITDQERILAMRTAGGYIGMMDGDVLLDGATAADFGALTALTSARGSVGYALDAAGVYQSFGINVLRRSGRGLLLEAAATQLLTQPVDLSHGDWIKTAMTAVAAAAGAPDGIGSAYDLTESTTATGASAILQRNISSAAAGNYCWSAHLARGLRRYTQMFIVVDSSTYAVTVDWDAAGGPAILVASGALIPAAYGLEHIAGGLYRAWLAVTTGATTTLQFSIRGAGGPTFADRLYDTAAGQVYARASWAQVEIGLRPSSPVTTGSGSRAADVAALAWAGNASPDDQIIIAYDGETAELTRADLADSAELDLMADGGAPWLGRYITAIYLLPARAADFHAQYDDIDSRVAGAVGAAIRPMLAGVNRALAEAGLAPVASAIPAALDFPATPHGCAPWMVVGADGVFWAGQRYPAEANMLAASGGVKVGQQRLWAAQAVGDSIIGTVGFDGGTGGFTLVAGGAVAQTGGKLEFTSSASTGTFARLIRGYPGRAFRVSAVYTKGTAAGGRIGASSYNSTLNLGPSLAATSTAALSVYFTPAAGRDWWVGGGQNGGGLGTSLFDDFEVREVWPAEGFPQGIHTALITGTAPNPLPASGRQVLWAGDCGNAYSETTVAIDSAGAVTMTSKRWGITGGTDYTQAATLSLGTLTAGQAFRLALGQSHSLIRAALNGAAAEADAVGVNGFAYLRLGQSQTAGEEWAGTIDSYAVYAGIETLQWMADATDTTVRVPAEAKSARRVVVNGDSWSEISSSGIGPMVSDLGYDVINIGVGGSTMAAQKAVWDAATGLHHLPLIWWDGVPNGHTDGQHAIETAMIADTLTAMGHERLLWCRNGLAQVTGTQHADMTAVADWVRYQLGPDAVYDMTALMTRLAIQDPGDPGYASDQARLASGYCPFSLMQLDQAHLLPWVRREVAREMQPAIERLLVRA